MRAPLGPFPQPETYDHVLPFTPPAGRDLFFYRGNFCGLYLEGAPIVPGCNARNPECVMACLLDHYPREIQDEYLKRYAQYYTHLQRSWGHALPNDGWTGSTIDEFVDLSARAQKAGLFCDQWIIGGGALYNCNQTLDYWRPIIDQLCDALIANKVVDTACVGWQLDQLFGAIPGNPCIEVIAYIAEKLPQSVPLATHWMNHALAWWKDGGEQWTDKYQSRWVENRFDWWIVMQPYLSGGYFQGNTTMARTDPKMFQDIMKDTLDPFCGETGKGDMGRSQRDNRDQPFGLNIFECTGQDQFDAVCTEDDGDLTGFLLMCTTAFDGKGHCNGYGNGARMPDGSVL